MNTILLTKGCKRVSMLLIAATLSFSSFAHKVETFIFNCTGPGQPMQIDAIITATASNTWYQWEYRDNSGVWTCFVNGTNTINGSSFTVSGATSANVLNDAPLLTISSATAALNNVLVRVTMRDGAAPCGAPAGTVYGGDDLLGYLTRFLRLNVFSNATVCPPNSFLCEGNILFNAEGYYGSFENKFYDAGTDSYINHNFVSGPTTIASSDLTEGAADGSGTAGTYTHINNPINQSQFFTLNIAPHYGNFQMVVNGPASTTARTWYKSVPVTAGTSYAFTLFAARVDGTDPLITLQVNGSTVQSYDMSLQPVGKWWRIAGQYTASSTGNITISVLDTRAGGLNNYSIDDICFRSCTNCATLPLHRLELTTTLNGNTVGLKWLAENEMNTSQFIVERSTNGVAYEQVGMKPAGGLTNILTEYRSTDDIQSLSSASIIYYRIRAVDNDGKYAYSNIVTVRLSKKAGIQIWPSPFNDYLSISYNAAGSTQVSVDIVNSVGKSVSLNSYQVNRGLNQLSVSGLEKLSAGIYYIRITDNNTNETYIQKLIK